MRPSIPRGLAPLAAAALFPLVALAAPADAQPAGASAAETTPRLVVASSEPAAKIPGLDTLPELDPAVPSPNEVLGYPLGSRFTPHHRVRDYFERLASSSDRVRVEAYGETYEGRALELAIIASPANLERLETIREGLGRLAHPQKLSSGERQRLVETLPAVVWLAYGVHGNESSSTEVAMATAYVLAAARGALAERLDEVVVVIDPLVNPDGRDRFVHGFEQRLGRAPDATAEALEHYEDWPGGRYNHYLFDLNRDWAWATQQETRLRLAAYRRWEPQVYADFHEMGYESSYFFPPPADPILGQIDRRTLAWLETFGRANAAAFDERGWLYYKAEVFDLFYPGYGDSYPALRGAVGMTYEVAGGGRGGQVVDRRDGTLTLADRMARHFTTSLATVDTAARHRRRLLEDFAAARAQSLLDPARLFVWPGERDGRALAELLAAHGVEVLRTLRPTALEATAVVNGESATVELAAGSFAVSTAQPLGALVRTLLGREAQMPASFVARQRKLLEGRRDTEFADITAWSLAYAFDVELWEVDAAHAVDPRWLGPAGELEPRAPAMRGEGSYAFLVRPQGLASYRFAAELGRRGLPHRLALSGFETAASGFEPGTLVIPAAGEAGALAPELGEIAAASGVEVERTASAFTSVGLSLGSEQVVPVRAARIGLFGGPGTTPTAHGALWHLFDRTLDVPHSRLRLDLAERIDLDAFDVLILPGGRGADRALGEAGGEALVDWVESGGVLIAIEDAAELLRELELSSFEPWETREADETEGDDALADRPISTPGAALATRLSPDHPLAIGLTRPPAVLVRGSTVLAASGDPRRDLLVAVDEDPVIAGFAWPEAEERLAGSLLAGVERAGDGLVVTFVHDPAFREMWRATMPLLLNAALFGPSLLETGALR